MMANGFNHFHHCPLTIDRWPLTVAFHPGIQGLRKTCVTPPRDMPLPRRQILDFRLALGYIRGVALTPFLRYCFIPMVTCVNILPAGERRSFTADCYANLFPIAGDVRIGPFAM